MFNFTDKNGRTYKVQCLGRYSTIRSEKKLKSTIDATIDAMINGEGQYNTTNKEAWKKYGEAVKTKTYMEAIALFGIRIQKTVVSK